MSILNLLPDNAERSGRSASRAGRDLLAATLAELQALRGGRSPASSRTR